MGVSLFLRVSVFLQRFLFAIALSYFLTSFSSHCQPLTNGDFRPNNMTGNGLAQVSPPAPATLEASTLTKRAYMHLDFRLPASGIMGQ